MFIYVINIFKIYSLREIKKSSKSDFTFAIFFPRGTSSRRLLVVRISPFGSVKTQNCPKRKRKRNYTKLYPSGRESRKLNGSERRMEPRRERCRWREIVVASEVEVVLTGSALRPGPCRLVRQVFPLRMKDIN